MLTSRIERTVSGREFKQCQRMRVRFMRHSCQSGQQRVRPDVAVNRLIAPASEIDPQQPTGSGPMSGRFRRFSSLPAR